MDSAQDTGRSVRGMKHDNGKPRWDLLPWRPVTEVVKVLTFGAGKYGADNWQTVPNARNRYFAAAMRHLTAWESGERLDPESGYHHLAHAICCLLFLMWKKPGCKVGELYVDIHTRVNPVPDIFMFTCPHCSYKMEMDKLNTAIYCEKCEVQWVLVNNQWMIRK